MRMSDWSSDVCSSDLATRAVLSAVSMAVREADDGSATALMRTIVEASRPALELASAWGKSAGFEPDPDDGPDVSALLPGAARRQRAGVHVWEVEERRGGDGGVRTKRDGWKRNR